MNFQILSDIHTEFHADCGVSFCEDLPGGDCLIIAGDFCTWKDLSQPLHLLSIIEKKYDRVLYVPGNHEYYGIEPSSCILPGTKRVSVLDNGFVQIDGRRFFGGTLWFEEPPPQVEPLKRLFNDFLLIQGFEPWVYTKHFYFLRLLNSHCRPGDVVITHHAPSYRSVHPRYAGHPSNHFFANDLDELILALAPSYWIHGHLHTGCDYKLGHTRVLCNPFGYPYETNTLNSFNSHLIIEL